MAYSMNWRPQLDEISENGKPEQSHSRALGPIPGILPPSRTAPQAPHAGPSLTSRANGTQFSSSYSMNWRPKYEDEEDEEEQMKPLPVAAGHTFASSRARHGDVQEGKANNDERVFQVSLAEDCPTVECIGKHSYACVQDGLACTLEKGEGVPSIGVPAKWTLHLHPAQAKLSHRQTYQLSQVLYCCLYAALSKSGEQAIRLKLLDSSSLGQSARKALHDLGIPLDLSLPITPSYLLQLYTYAESHLLLPSFPYFASQSFQGTRKPIAHPARPPAFQSSPELVYSRYESASRQHLKIYAQDGSGGSQWLTVIPAQSPASKESAQSQTPPIQLLYALEDPAFEQVAEQVQDYDRAIRLDGEAASCWSSYQAHFKSICHYAFMTERRSIRLWTVSDNSEIIEGLAMKGWKTARSAEGVSYSSIAYITQKDFWESITNL